MTQARRERAEQIIRKRLGSVYTSRATMDDCLDKLMEWAAQEAEQARREERERCAGIAEEWGDLAKNETQSENSDFLYRLADALRAASPPA